MSVPPPSRMLRAVLCAVLLACSFPAPAMPSALTCYDDNYEPYFIHNEGRFSGINVEVLLEAARRIGIRMEFRLLPFKRLKSELARSRESGVSCAFAFSRTPRREQFLEFGKVPLNVTDYTLFVRGADQRFTTLNDLEGKTIGVRAGFRLPDTVAEGAAAGRWRLDEASSDQVNFQKLAMRRIDAVLADKTIGLYTVRHRPDEVRLLAPSVMRFETYLVFAKSHDAPALAAAFDGALDAMQQDGTVDRIMAAYFAPPPAQKKSQGEVKTYAAWNRGMVEKRLP